MALKCTVREYLVRHVTFVVTFAVHVTNLTKPRRSLTTLPPSATSPPSGVMTQSSPCPLDAHSQQLRSMCTHWMRGQVSVYARVMCVPLCAFYMRAQGVCVNSHQQPLATNNPAPALLVCVSNSACVYHDHIVHRCQSQVHSAQPQGQGVAHGGGWWSQCDLRRQVTSLVLFCVSLRDVAFALWLLAADGGVTMLVFLTYLCHLSSTLTMLYISLLCNHVHALNYMFKCSPHPYFLFHVHLLASLLHTKRRHCWRPGLCTGAWQLRRVLRSSQHSRDVRVCKDGAGVCSSKPRQARARTADWGRHCKLHRYTIVGVRGGVCFN